MAQEKLKTYCRFCHAYCPMLATVENNKLTALEPDTDNEIYGGYTCLKGRQLPEQQYHPERILTSLKKNADGSRTELGSAQALDEIADKDDVTILNISGTELRRRLAEGLDIPEWFSFPEVVTELRKTRPPRSQQGFTVFFTGFSGSGKSTIANALMVKLMEMGGRPVTLLDGDIVRKNLSSELGFSKEHRDLNIRRIGYVASEITKNGGIAICAPIAPYATTRRAVREEIEQFGAFLEVHVATSLEECERRDRKGLYKLAREGKIKEFTGISDPYDVPETPELRVETENVEVDNCAHQVILKLESLGLITGQ